MKIVSGRTGSPHVTSQQFRQMLEGIIGQGSYIITSGENLKPELSSNNLMKIRSGMMAHHGCISCVDIGTYDEVTLTNGSQGMKRIDLIVNRYTRNAETEVENCSWKVIQGTPVASNPAVPAYTSGNLQNGDLVDDCPAFEVHYDGINVTEVKSLLSVADGLSELSSNLTKANNILTNMESNLMAINTYHMTLNTSNVKTSDSWIECNRIGNLVMVNGCVKITKDVNVYTGINLASGAPAPCCDKQLYTGAIAQDNTYSSCLLSVSENGEINLYVRWKKALAGDVFYYEFCYICK
jgi:hypothetical protein